MAAEHFEKLSGETVGQGFLILRWATKNMALIFLKVPRNSGL